MDTSKKDIENTLGYTPRVLDPFAGGGAIPLEALRLGCETYASDYNPVAVLILKAVLEYPQKYSEKLVEDVKKWRKWVLEEAKKEIGRFYPNDVQKGYFVRAKNTFQSATSGQGRFLVKTHLVMLKFL